MRPTRTATRLATLILFGAVWLVAAGLLWRTRVPGDLHLAHLDPGDYFSRAELRRTAAHDTFLRIDFLLAVLAQLGALALVAARAPALADRVPGPSVVKGLGLALIAYASAWLARLPFGLAGHWWERRYGLAPRGYLDWLWHRLPGIGSIGLLLGGVLVAMLLARALGPRWWLAAAPIAVAVAALLVLVQPLLGPRLRALPRGPAATEIRALTDDVRIGVERVSTRTRRVNAEAIGLGPTRRIVFWDTLFRRGFRPAELRVLAAHEATHLARRHAWKGLGWFALFAFPCAFVVARVTARRGGPSNPAAVPLLLLAVACLQVVALPVAGAITRRYEAEADWVALERTRDPAGAQSLFRHFAIANVDQPDPPRWSFLLLGDHPTLMQRIAMARAWATRAAAPPGGS